jgi:hypothetical protein
MLAKVFPVFCMIKTPLIHGRGLGVGKQKHKKEKFKREKDGGNSTDQHYPIEIAQQLDRL